MQVDKETKDETIFFDRAANTHAGDPSSMQNVLCLPKQVHACIVNVRRSACELRMHIYTSATLATLNTMQSLMNP